MTRVEALTELKLHVRELTKKVMIDIKSHEPFTARLNHLENKFLHTIELCLWSYKRLEPPSTAQKRCVTRNRKLLTWKKNITCPPAWISS